MLVEVEIRLVCGVKRFYPVNKEAKALCQILDQKTLDERHLTICRKTGWIVSYAPQHNQDK